MVSDREDVLLEGGKPFRSLEKIMAGVSYYEMILSPFPIIYK